jgi:hypothetical protein
MDWKIGLQFPAGALIILFTTRQKPASGSVRPTIHSTRSHSRNINQPSVKLNIHLQEMQRLKTRECFSSFPAYVSRGVLLRERNILAVYLL